MSLDHKPFEKKFDRKPFQKRLERKPFEKRFYRKLFQKKFDQKRMESKNDIIGVINRRNGFDATVLIKRRHACGSTIAAYLFILFRRVEIVAVI